MDEVEDRLQLGATVKRRATALFLPYHPAPRRCQRLDLSIEVRVDGRCSGISDLGLISVHSGCAYDDKCSIYKNGSKVKDHRLTPEASLGGM